MLKRKMKWCRIGRQLAHNKLEDRSTFNASPIVFNGTLILRSDENLYGIKKMN